MLSAVCLLAISACGFHMRGATRLPAVVSAIYISGLDTNGAFAVDLKRQLKVNGVKAVEQAKATSVLKITRREQGRRVLTVGQDGKVREYELYLLISFEVNSREGSSLLENQTINLSRDFIFDQDDVLGKAAEQELIYDDMNSDAVRLIIYRLQAISGTEGR